MFEDLRVISDAIALANRGKREESMKRLEGHEFGPESKPLALIQKARLLEESDTEQCSQVYRDALEKYPNDPAVHLRAGVFVFKRGDTERARQLLLRSWNRSKTPEAGYYLGAINRSEARPEHALSFFTQTAVIEGDEGYWRNRAVKEARLG